MLTMKKNHASDSRGLTVVDAVESAVEEAVLRAVTKEDDHWFNLARVIVRQYEIDRRAA